MVSTLHGAWPTEFGNLYSWGWAAWDMEKEFLIGVGFPWVSFSFRARLTQSLAKLWDALLGCAAHSGI